MTNKEHAEKILTSGKTTGEILKQLEMLHELRELRRDIENTYGELCMKIIMEKKLDKLLGDKQ